jgi:Ni,Fe-hydrogenase III large subunit
LIPDFVEQKEIVEINDNIQISAIFEINDKTIALLSDIENKRTILNTVPLRLSEEVDILLKGGAKPGDQIDLDTGGKVEGYGVFAFSYGPVSAGIPEAGGFKLITYGERIVKVIPQINFKKRGIENKTVGMKPDSALLLVERSAGNFSASYSTCFVTAVEDVLNLEVPSKARWIRAIAIELERIYNHLYVFARLSEAAAQNVAAAEANALREQVLRLNARYFGHRYLFGFNRIGGVSQNLLSKDKRRSLANDIKNTTQKFSHLVTYFLSSRIFLDRLQNTAKLLHQDALKLGAVGPSARASAIDWDDRLTYPIEPYNDVFVEIETENEEDAMARTMVRIREIRSSMLVLEQLLDKMPSDEGGIPNKPSRYRLNSNKDDFSFCRIESPSGDLIQVVQLDQGGRIKFLHIRPPSLVNWLPFAKSLEGNVFTDFQFAYESFGLSYADSDR